MTTAEKDSVAPLAQAVRPLLLPEISVKLALGASVQRDSPEVIVSFEGDAVRLHEIDFLMAEKVAERVRSKLRKPVSRTSVISAVIHAQQFLAEELFRPDTLRILF